jgi:arsenate reductase-like glutaredoxin family protein
MSKSSESGNPTAHARLSDSSKSGVFRPQMVDLHQRPMAPTEIRRFADRFGLVALLDTQGKSYVDAGLKYLRMSDADILSRIERELQLLRLPLVRAGNRLSIGRDEEAWKAMAEALVR